MTNRVGEKPVARAYFEGDVQSLRRSLDRQLGRGAFDDIVYLTKQNNYKAAAGIIKNGVR